MLRVYELGNVDLSNNGVGFVIDAFDIVQEIELNGVDKLSFSLPINSKYNKYVDASKYLIECEGSLYYPIIVNEDDKNNSVNVVCRHYINFLNIVKYILYLPVQAGKTVKQVLEKTMEIFFEDTDDDFKRKYNFELFTNEELGELGMEWVEEKIDIVDGMANTDVISIISACIELARHGELFYRNNKFAIVKRVGIDTNYLWTPVKNINDLVQNIDYTNIMNKIYIEGLDGMPLDVSKYHNSQIISQESIDKYGLREGRLEFSDVDNKEELEAKALWEISPLNPDRVDMPKLTISVSSNDITEKLNIGDTIRIVSHKLNIDVRKRIVKITNNHLSKINNYIIGDKPLSLESMLTKLNATRERLNKLTTPNDLIKISGLEQLVPYIQSGKNYVNNSSFEDVDELGGAKCWFSTDSNITTVEESRFGTRSLKLMQGIKVSTADGYEIDKTKYEKESSKTIVSFYHKGEAIQVYLTDENNEPVPCITSLSGEEYVFFAEFPKTESWGNQKFLIFNNQDLETNKFKINFQNYGVEASYIDGVMAQPSLQNRMQLYIDGENSLPVNQSILDSINNAVKYSIDENNGDIELLPNVETDVIIKTLDVNEKTDLSYFFTISLEESTNKKLLQMSIYDAATMKESYKFVMSNKEDTKTIANNMKALQAGPHSLYIKLTNLGTETITLLKNKSRLSMSGKNVKMDEIPPIPVINVFDTWNGIDITTQLQSFFDEINISGISENVDMFIE